MADPILVKLLAEAAFTGRERQGKQEQTACDYLRSCHFPSAIGGAYNVSCHKSLFSALRMAGGG